MSSRVVSSVLVVASCAGCTLREPLAAPPPMMPSDASLVAYGSRPTRAQVDAARPRISRTVRIGAGDDDDAYGRQVGDPRASLDSAPSPPPFSTLTPSNAYGAGYGLGYAGYGWGRGARGASRVAPGVSGGGRGPAPGTPGVAGDWEKPADHGPTFPTPSAAGVSR